MTFCLNATLQPSIMPDNAPKNIYQAPHSDLLQDARVMNSVDTILGLPTQIFALGLVLSVLIFILANSWFAVFVAVLYYPTMYRLHETDPRAISAWVSSINAPMHWHAGLSKRRTYLDFDQQD